MSDRPRLPGQGHQATDRPRHRGGVARPTGDHCSALTRHRNCSPRPAGWRSNRTARHRPGRSRLAQPARPHGLRPGVARTARHHQRRPRPHTTRRLQPASRPHPTDSSTSSKTAGTRSTSNGPRTSGPLSHAPARNSASVRERRLALIGAGAARPYQEGPGHGGRRGAPERRLSDQCRRALDAVTAAVVLRRLFLALANVRVRGHGPAQSVSTEERHEDRRDEPHHA